MQDRANMKTLLAVVFSVLSLSAFALPANMATSVNFHLTVTKQGPTNGQSVASATEPFTSKTLIGEIGAQLQIDFSPQAQLLEVWNISYSTNFLYTTNGLNVKTTKVKTVKVTLEKLVIKDGAFTTNISALVSSTPVGEKVIKQQGPTTQFAINNVTINTSPSLSFTGFATSVLRWPANGNPIYSESWSIIGTVGDMIAEGSMSVSLVAYNVPY